MSATTAAMQDTRCWAEQLNPTKMNVTCYGTVMLNLYIHYLYYASLYFQMLKSILKYQYTSTATLKLILVGIYK